VPGPLWRQVQDSNLRRCTPTDLQPNRPATAPRGRAIARRAPKVNRCLLLVHQGDTVEQGRQPVLERCAAVVARPEYVLDGHLEEVRKLRSGERLHDGRGHRCEFRLVTEGQVDFLEHESVYEAVDCRDGVGGLRDREATLAKAPDAGFEQTERGRPRI